MFLIKKNSASKIELLEHKEVAEDNNIDNNGKRRESYIASEVVISGQIKGKGKLILKGVFEGKADIDGEILVGESATLKADIRAKTLIIAGKIEGQIYATESVKVLSTGNVKGTITAGNLLIETGAKFRGNSVVIEDDALVIAQMDTEESVDV